MKRKPYSGGRDRAKSSALLGLYLLACLITAAGAVMAACSVIYNVHFQVMTSSVHGAVFGAVVMFLGVRYCFSVRKLERELENEGEHLPDGAA